MRIHFNKKYFLKMLCYTLSFIVIYYIFYSGSQNLGKKITDITIYLDLYDVVNWENMIFLRYEKLFLATIIILKNIGLDAVLAYSILGFFCIFLHEKALELLNIKNKRYVYLLYFIFPFLYDIVQIRFFLASSIAIYAICFYMIKPNKHFLFVILILIAFLFHKISIVYLLFLISTKFEFKTNILITILFFFAVTVLLNSSFLYTNTETLYAINNTSDYSYINVIIVFIRQMIMIYLLIMAYNLLKSNNIGISTNVLRLIKFNIMLFVFIAGFLVKREGLDYFRIYRGVYFLNYAIMLYPFSYKIKGKSIYKMKIICGYLIILFTFFIADYFQVIEIYLNL